MFLNIAQSHPPFAIYKVRRKRNLVRRPIWFGKLAIYNLNLTIPFKQ